MLIRKKYDLINLNKGSYLDFLRADGNSYIFRISG